MYYGKVGDWKCADFSCYYEAQEKEFINGMSVDLVSAPLYICPKCGTEDVFPAHDTDWLAKEGSAAKQIKLQGASRWDECDE